MMILVANLKNRGISISPPNGDPKEQVSVDLTVGGMYQKSGDPDWLHIEDSLTISPGSCVVVQTAENLKMPNNAFGLLATKGSIGGKGIMTANTKLDPLFEGHLNIPIYNVSQRKVEIKKGQSFCSISFWTTESPVIGTGTRNAIKVQPRTNSRISDFFQRNAAHFITGGISFFGAIIAALITVYLRTN